MPQSLILLMTRYGMNVRLTHPPEFRLMPDIVAQAEANARASHGSFEILDDFDAGFEGADVVYPKSWGSMLTTSDKAESARIGANYQDWICDERRMALAKDDAIYMHCLPADRNVEVTDAVIDGPQQRGVRRGGEPPPRAEGGNGAHHVRRAAARREVRMRAKRAVVAIGGNSLIKDKHHQTVADQYQAMKDTTASIADMVAAGWEVAITHGNGPQVGFILRRSELSRHELHEVPLDACGADSQGAIGYALQQTMSQPPAGQGDRSGGGHGGHPGRGEPRRPGVDPPLQAHRVVHDRRDGRRAQGRRRLGGGGGRRARLAPGGVLAGARCASWRPTWCGCSSTPGSS